MNQSRGRIVLGTAALVVVVVATVLLVAPGRVQALYDPEIKYFPDGQDPGEGVRIVGCCDKWDWTGRHHHNEFGFCHFLLKETEGCNDCCKDMGKKSKAGYHDHETDCECVGHFSDSNYRASQQSQITFRSYKRT